MESSEEPTSLQTICHPRAADLFPKETPDFYCEDPNLTAPFTLLDGEYVVALGRTSDGVLALTNYRLYLNSSQACYNVPLGLIEHLEVKEIFYLHISCKDARSLSCAFSTNEHCLEWFKRLHKVTQPKKSIEAMFAFAYYAWAMEEGKESARLGKDLKVCPEVNTIQSEVERLKFNKHGNWRITYVNKDYQMCPTYPPMILIPACISDETLLCVSKFRSSRRVPAVVWRHVGNGAVIARSSQPEVGWLGWRSSEDEDLLKAISDACSYDIGECTATDPANGSDPVVADEPVAPKSTKKVLIVDARSYTTAVANRARGGGCECAEYYSNCDIQFMNLPNIHSIRKSFHMLRQLCASDPDQNNWLSCLEGTRWLQHMSGLLRAAVTVASAVERDGRPVLVHCSDGWDRTPQIVALAQILLDPYYRTMEGFQLLCEREWLDFGHKFGDRCGQTINNEDANERCPVFLQWLDCVHQLIEQFKCSFQMSSAYIVKLAQHTYSQLFGTFLCNSKNERTQQRIRERTFSAWRFLNSPCFVNHLYAPSKNKVLWPSCNVRDLKLWTDVYLGTVETAMNGNDKQPRVSMIDIETGDNEKPQGHMTKTRSYGDLIQAQDHAALHRRLSDPSLSVEKKFDSLSLKSDSEKIETNNVSDIIQAVSENIKETEEKNLPNGESNSTEGPVNTSSSDSSTDTIILNGDIVVAKNNEEEDLSPATTNHVQEADAQWIDTTTVTAAVTVAVNRQSCNNRNHNEGGSDVSETSAPLVSRTPSSICPASPIHQDILMENLDRLDDIDGLPVIHCDVQMRVQQIIIENKLREEALRKELYTTRMALLKQVCNHNTDAERVDESGSLPDSVGSAGDHGESLPSDMSWEALDEPGPPPTLWVPDHAVNRCQGCNTEFWLGRRKHHCRCCGKIFCADCSENWTPLPSEQLFNPVRVCSQCYSRVHHHNASPCQCATATTPPTISTPAVNNLLVRQQITNEQPEACHRSATRKDNKDVSQYQLVQQKQAQQPPIVDASSAN